MPTAQTRQQSSVFKARWGGVRSTKRHKEVQACQKVAIEVIYVEDVHMWIWGIIGGDDNEHHQIWG